MKQIYSLILLIFLLASVSVSVGQQRQRPHTGRPSTESALPASVRESNTRSNPTVSLPVGARVATQRTQNNGRARNQQTNFVVQAANYYVTTVDEPWGRSSNTDALSNALGVSNWSKVTFDDPDVLTIFNANTTFIFLEGSDINAIELNDFLMANRTTIETWVSNGGRLLLNAAPNEGGDIDFGFDGTTLNYNNGQGSVNVIGPLLTNPNALSTSGYEGGSFSHAHITGNGIMPLILGEDFEIIVLGEKLYGNGLVVFGGMTQSSFHRPQPDANNLMTNIVHYLANNNILPTVPEAAIFANKTSFVTNRVATLMDVSRNYPTSTTWHISPATFEYTEDTNEHSRTIKVKFTAPGAYTITLRVSNAEGENELVKEDYINVRIPYNFYWVGGSGSWADYENHWVTSSGGTEFHTQIPTEDDNVFFDANSFGAANEVVTMGDEVFAANVDFTGVQHTPTLTDGRLSINGSLTAPDPMLFGGSDFYMYSSEKETIDISGVQFPDEEHGLYIDGPGSYEIVSPIDNNGYLYIYMGAVTTNGHTISVDDFEISSDEDNTPATIDFENGELHVADYFGGYVDEVYPFIGDVKLFLGKDGGEANFYGDDLTIGQVTLVGGEVEFNDDVTIGHLTILPGAEVLQSDNETFTVGTIDIKGTAVQPINLHDFTIDKASGVIVAEYVILNNVIATGGATFYADKNSVDNGGNTGWIFSTKETQNITFEGPETKTFGDVDFDLTASSSSDLVVAFEVASGPATLSGNTLTLTGAGEVTIKALQEGDDDFTPAQDVLQSFVVDKATQNLDFTITNNLTYGQAPVTLDVTSGQTGNAIVFTVTEGPGSISGTTLTLNGAGLITVKATQEGNENYTPALVTKQFDVAKSAQAITFNLPATKTFGDAPLNLAATGGASGNPVTYNVVSGSATLSGNALTITGAGTVVIKASQAGNSNYNAAAEVTKEIVVEKAVQAITFNPPATKTFGDAPLNLAATGGASGNPVTYNVVSGSATLSGNTLTITGAGTVVIKALQAGNNNYHAAEVSKEIVVEKAVQALTFSSIATKTFGDAPFNLTATGGASGNAVIFSVVTGSATVSGNILTLTAAGPVTVKASQEGNTNYLAAAPIEQTFCVNPEKPVVTVTGLDTDAPTLTSTTAEAYQWYNRGVALSGATGKTFTVTDGGVYTVVTNSASCVSVTSDAQVLIVTGLEAALETFVSTYPNPVVNELTVDMSAINSQHEAVIVLYDATGKAVTTAKAKGLVSIPMVTYNPGRYTVVVTFGKQRVAKHIIKK